MRSECWIIGFRIIEILPHILNKQNRKIGRFVEYIRMFHKFLSHQTRNDFKWLYLYKYDSPLKFLSTPYNMDSMWSRRKHLRHVMLRCFEKGNSENDTKNEICVYKNSATITIVRNCFQKFNVGNFYLKDEDCNGHPATNTDLIKAMLAENP